MGSASQSQDAARHRARRLAARLESGAGLTPDQTPIGLAWQKRHLNATTAPKFFNGADMNVGVQMGEYSNGLTDVDLDCHEGR